MNIKTIIQFSAAARITATSMLKKTNRIHLSQHIALAIILSPLRVLGLLHIGLKNTLSKYLGGIYVQH